MPSVLLAAVLAAAVPDRVITIGAHPLRLHFANAGADGPLVVYATGDGGWHRKDVDTFRHLAALGFPIVGFDAHDYVQHLGGTAGPASVAGDYQSIVAAARDALRLAADRPVLLAGVSRGAGLSVVAAAAALPEWRLAGVVAVALTREEEYVHHRGRERAEMAAPYDELPGLGPIPVAVIQSTRDGYVPAAEARQLFGPDTPYRWLVPVEARNHSFGGGRAQLYAALTRAVHWAAKTGTGPISARGKTGTGPVSWKRGQVSSSEIGRSSGSFR